MLTIQNFHKLFRRDVHRYRIGGAVETNTQYVIRLFNPTQKSFPVYLERQYQISTNPETLQPDISYKMWYRKDTTNKIESIYFTPKHFQTPDTFLKALNLLIM